MPETNDPPIIINGGSVTIDFDTAQLPPNGNGKHSNPNKTLRYIKITGDGVNYSADFPTGQGVTIKIWYDNGNSAKP